MCNATNRAGLFFIAGREQNGFRHHVATASRSRPQVGSRDKSLAVHEPIGPVGSRMGVSDRAPHRCAQAQWYSDAGGRSQAAQASHALKIERLHRRAGCSPATHPHHAEPSGRARDPHRRMAWLTSIRTSPAHRRHATGVQLGLCIDLARAAKRALANFGHRGFGGQRHRCRIDIALVAAVVAVDPSQSR